MKETIATAWALFVLCQGTFALIPGQNELKPRPDNMFWITDAPGESFDDKFAACVKASMDATPNVVRIRIPWTGASWKMERPVELKPATGDQLRVNIVGDDVWNLIEYVGLGGRGASKTAIFRFYGLKDSTLTSIRIIDHASNVIGFDLATGDEYQSEGNNRLTRCRFQPLGETIQTYGFRIGYSTDPSGPNDHSASVLEQCSVNYYAPGAVIGNNGSSGKLKTITRAGHRAFVIQGANTCFLRLNDCVADGSIGITTKGLDGQQAGGSGTVVTNFGTSGAPIVYDLNLGFSFFSDGGRHELGGTFAIVGNPREGNGNQGHVSFRDQLIDDFAPTTVASLIGTFPGSLVSLHDASQAVLENLAINNNGQGDTLDSNWLSLYTTSSTERPSVAITAVTLANGVGSARAYVPVTAGRVRGGVWKQSVDGIVQSANVDRSGQ